MEKQVSTTREALMAELLIDVDRLLTKVGVLDQSLGETIEKATKDAASKGYLAASLQIKNLTEDLVIRIGQASLKAESAHPQSKSTQPIQTPSRLSQTVLVKLFTVCFSGGLLGTLLGQVLFMLV